MCSPTSGSTFTSARTAPERAATMPAATANAQRRREGFMPRILLFGLGDLDAVSPARPWRGTWRSRPGAAACSRDVAACRPAPGGRGTTRRPSDAVMRSSGVGGACWSTARRAPRRRSPAAASRRSARARSRSAPGQDDDELVAAVARDQRRGGRVVAQQLAHLLQRPAARQVAEAIVDLLEAVEVDEQHRQVRPARGRRARSPPRGGCGSSGCWRGRSDRRCAPGRARGSRRARSGSTTTCTRRRSAAAPCRAACTSRPSAGSPAAARRRSTRRRRSARRPASGPVRCRAPGPSSGSSGSR